MYWTLKKHFNQVMMTEKGMNGEDLFKEEFSHYTILSKQPNYFKPPGIVTACIKGPDIKREHAVVGGTEEEPTVTENTDLKDVQAAWLAMDSQVVSDASEEFHTGREVSQLAFMGEYLFRILAPELYVTSGLVARRALGTYLVNDPLDTEAKIVEYHKLALKDLSDKRNAEILNYLTFKASKGL